MLKNRNELMKILKVEAEEKPKSKKNIDYVKVIEDIELYIADGIKLVFSVSQKDEESPCHVDVRTWVEGEKYTGPTKKGINFNIEYLDEVIEVLKTLNKECD